MAKKDIKTILATDCGSTTSKARFFRKIGNEFRFIVAGEAPTTVEAPYEDVTLGVLNAIREVEELTGHRILGPNGIISPPKSDNEGVDLYVTTSSAGGGLQMSVAGVVASMTAESAQRAALGAGAIVMDVISIDDGREPFEKIESLRILRPDMILIAGGTDGGTIYHVDSLTQFIRLADPKPRLGQGYMLPIVYAGNKNAQGIVRKNLEKFSLQIVDNIRPSMDVENPEPARMAVHEQFMEHVMSHAPGYNKLMKWTAVPIMPTPAGEGMMFRAYGEQRNVNVIGVGLGGATTNIYSVYDGKFVRSVSANLGMSYSMCNVLKEAGIDNIMRWIPFDIEGVEVINRLRNKMIRPTIIPQTIKDLMIEQAAAREALRLGFQHHKSLARPLLGTVRGGDIGRMGFESGRTETYIDMMHISAVGGTGGLLSHAPRRVQSALVLIDGFQVEGVTMLFQDSVFMMPHLGVISTVQPEAAVEIFEKDCIVRLGTCITPRGQVGDGGARIATVSIKMPNGEVVEEEMIGGTIKRIPLEEGQTAEAEIRPALRFDVGSGVGRRVSAKIEGGTAGVILDARGRPLKLPEEAGERRRKLLEWFKALDAYPGKFLENI